MSLYKDIDIDSKTIFIANQLVILFIRIFGHFLTYSNFALAKHTPHFEAAPMRIVYNAFSYLEGVIIQGMISGFLYSRV